MRRAFAALVGHRNLITRLYLVELAVSFVTVLATGWTLKMLFGQHPLFDRAVERDLAALAFSIKAHDGLVPTMLATVAALSVGYRVLSWYLEAILVGALTSSPHAAGGRFFPFVRLWAWSIVPMLVALGVIGLGVSLGERENALTWSQALVGPLLGALPGCLLLAFLFAAIDYGKIALVVEGSSSSLRALGRGFGFVFRRPETVVPTLVYAVACVLLFAVYNFLFTAPAFAGFAGALVLFLVRQLFLGARFWWRCAAWAAQIEFAQPSQPGRPSRPSNR